MKIKFLGQNCFLFTHNGKTILSDPFYNYQKDRSGFDISVQKIDYILITHAHGDHVADVEDVLTHYPEAVILSTPEICHYYQNAKSIDFNIGGSAKLDGLAITMVKADHTSTFPDGSNGGVAVGYIFRFDGKNIYLAGDTGVMADMQLFNGLYGETTLAILPIGSHYTMCARKAAFAAELLSAQKVIGCHFDTFPPIKINHEKAREKFKEKSIDFILPELGQEFEV